VKDQGSDSEVARWTAKTLLLLVLVW